MHGLMKTHIACYCLVLLALFRLFIGVSCNFGGIDLAQCNITKGCITNPPGCSLSDTCSQVITWAISPDDPNYIRFEMSTPRIVASRTVDYVAFALTKSASDYMRNASVLVCGLSGAPGTGSMATAYLSYNENYNSKPLVNQTELEVVKLVRSQVNDSFLMCVVDRKIRPMLAGIAFPLDQFWLPAIAAGRNRKTGGLGYHGPSKQGFDFPINCTEASTPNEDGPSIDKNLLRKLHGVFMMFGWMVCVACSILTPRYFRIHWTRPQIFGHKLWFLFHRTFMQMAVTCVIIGFVLILVVDDFLIIDMGPKYPDKLHPYFGLIAIIILFANPIGALFRSRPGDRRRLIFRRVHGLFGGLGFLFGAANVLIGSIVMYTYDSTLTLYPVIVWVCLHACIEIAYPTINFCATKFRNERRTDPTTEIAPPASNEMDPGVPITRKHTMYTIYTALFVVYLAATVTLWAAASALLFLK